MHLLAAASDRADTANAIAEVLDTLERAMAQDGLERAPDLLVVQTSANHDIAAIQAVARKAGVPTLHGATTSQGVMTGGRMVAEGGNGLGALALWDGGGAYASAAAALGEDPRTAARRATERALDKAGRAGEAPDLIWLGVAPGREEAVIAGIEDAVGANTPILGGSAADNAITGAWCVFDGDAHHADGVVVSVLFTSAPVALAYQSGYAPAQHAGTVTRAEGRTIHEIDGEAATAVYARWTGGRIAPNICHGPANVLAESTFHPLGRPLGAVAEVPFHLLAHPAVARPDGGLELFADVAVGERLQAMTGSVESLTARAGRVAALALRQGGLAPEDIAGALVVYCGGCMLGVRAQMDAVAADVDNALGGAPSLGLFTFGEQGPVVGGRNRHGNLMISCVVFAKA
ncbi:MAG: FIST N-terminal domain-containing protein [Pseudomonadota bacterium]